MRFLALALAALFGFAGVANAQTRPASWSYAFDANNVSTASYPGNVTISGQTTFSVASAITVTGCGTIMVDVTGTTADGTYISCAPVFSFYPSIGNDPGDHQRAQELIRFNSAQDATISETGLSIDARITTGFVPVWAQNTAYATNALVDVNGGVYKATTGGTSSAVGSGPSGTGSSIVDGTVTWAWQCHDQCNAKMPFFVSATASSGAGHVWAGDVALVLQNGWNGGFASAFEADISNGSGADCTTCQIFFATGLPGANKVQAAYAAYNPSASVNAWINAYQVAGTMGYSNAGFYDAAFGGTYGIQLAGAYSAAGIMMSHDNAQIRFGTSGTALNRWRMISSIAGASDGAFTLQHSTDNFVANFVNAFVADAGGNVAIGTSLALPSTTVGALPACNGTTVGQIRYVTDANGPTWNANLVGGGAVKTLALCNGANWTAH